MASPPAVSGAWEFGQPAVMLGLAVILAAAAIGFIESARPTPPVTLTHSGYAAQVYAGIYQRGTMLGREDASVTMTVYVDPQCPYCGEWERVAMPELVSRYVRNGTLRIIMRGLHFVGPDSERALRLLDAAALQNRFFQTAALLYWNQGEENTGWVTESYLRSLASSVPAADPKRLLADRNTAKVDAAIRADEQAAVRDSVASTPWIELGRTGGRSHHVELAQLDAAAVAPMIGRLVAKGAH